MIRTERSAALATVTIDRPEARNALTGEMMRTLIATLIELDEDPSVRVIILTGTDPAFCAGLDL